MSSKTQTSPIRVLGDRYKAVQILAALGLQGLLGSIQAEFGPTAKIMPTSHPRMACSLVNVHVTQLLQVVPFTPIDHYPLRHEVVICGVHCE